MLKLSAKIRDPKASLVTLRAEGLMPAVYYGKKTESTPISISQKEFTKLFEQAGESTVISMNADGTEVEVLIHEVDHDPVTGELRHADFYAFEKGHKLTVQVPIEFEGVSAAAKAGAQIVKVMHEVEVEALPKDLPHAVVVDLSRLEKVGDHVTVADVSLPAGVSIIASPEDVIVSASQPHEEKEEEAAPVDLSAIEVEKKGKQDEAGEESSGGNSSES